MVVISLRETMVVALNFKLRYVGVDFSQMKRNEKALNASTKNRKSAPSDYTRFGARTQHELSASYQSPTSLQGT